MDSSLRRAAIACGVVVPPLFVALFLVVGRQVKRQPETGLVQHLQVDQAQVE